MAREKKERVAELRAERRRWQIAKNALEKKALEKKALEEKALEEKALR